MQQRSAAAPGRGRERERASRRASGRASTHSEEQVAVSLACAGRTWDLSMNRTSSPKTNSPSSSRPAWLEGAEMLLKGRYGARHNSAAAQQGGQESERDAGTRGRGSESPAW